VSILFRYISGSLAKNLAGVLAAVVAVYLAVDFFEKIDDFMEAGAELSLAARFFALRIPFVVAQVGPVGVLLAALVVYGLMARHNEITAFLCGGAAPVRLLLPLFALGAAASLGLLCVSETAVPAASREANRIWHEKVRRDTIQSGGTRDLWFRGDRFIARVKMYVPEQEKATGMTLYWFDSDWNLARRIDAKRAAYGDGTWRFGKAVDQRMTGGVPEVSMERDLVLALPFGADDLARNVAESGEMTFSELADYAEKVAAEGYDASRYRVDLAARISFPFVCLIMAVLGGGLALRSVRGAGLPWIMVLAVALAFGYWVVHSLALSLGYAGRLPPVAAAWTANILYGALAATIAGRVKG